MLEIVDFVRVAGVPLLSLWNALNLHSSSLMIDTC